MGRIRKLVELAPGERWLLLRSWLLLWVVRLSLWTLPFAASRRLVSRLSRPGRRDRRQRFPADRLAWAVRTTSRFVPGAGHCLTQALATQILLARHRIPAKLHFGVQDDLTEDLKAHAWVESDGVAVIGGPEPGRYVRLLAPNDPPS